LRSLHRIRTTHNNAQRQRKAERERGVSVRDDETKGESVCVCVCGSLANRVHFLQCRFAVLVDAHRRGAKSRRRCDDRVRAAQLDALDVHCVCDVGESNRRGDCRVRYESRFASACSLCCVRRWRKLFFAAVSQSEQPTLECVSDTPVIESDPHTCNRDSDAPGRTRAVKCGARLQRSKKRKMMQKISFF
jgi:hypothetical protein